MVASPFATEMAEFERAVGVVRRFVHQAHPERLTGDQAMAIVGSFGELEKLAGSGMALFSPRVVQEGSFTKCGHASAPDWLAGVSGSSAGVAKGRLAAAEAARKSPELIDALHQGKLSAPQLDLVTNVLSSDPEAAPVFLGLVENQASHQELSGRAKQLKAAARSKEAEHQRRARIHATRHFRWFQLPDGGIKGEFLCDEAAWARVSPGLESATREKLKCSGDEGAENYDAHRLDAVLDLLGTSGGTDTRARPRVVVVVDAESLRRGTTTTGEICEIEGIGPVPVEAAQELLGEASVEFLVKEGRDVRTLTKASRDVAHKLVSALTVRDQACVVRTCGKRLGLQIDHCFVDYAEGGPTELANLALLCAPHHDMKTHGGWRLERDGDEWLWLPPERPPNAGAIARAKKVAVAKATAKRKRRDVPQLN